MPSLGAPEMLIILAVGLLLFGSTRLPKLARSMGRAQHEFKAGLEGQRDDPDQP
jgi:sec-independent protein translocase protein TatA